MPGAEKRPRSGSGCCGPNPPYPQSWYWTRAKPAQLLSPHTLADPVLRGEREAWTQTETEGETTFIFPVAERRWRILTHWSELLGDSFGSNWKLCSCPTSLDSRKPVSSVSWAGPSKGARLVFLNKFRLRKPIRQDVLFKSREEIQLLVLG